MLLLLFPLLTLSSDSMLNPAFMEVGMDPDPGPTLDTAYVPGTPGADWTEEEIESTRLRILQAIHPDWQVQTDMYGSVIWRTAVKITENKVMRLVFHDCMRYTDGTGGCDGCLNWHGMGEEAPSPFKTETFYTYAPVNFTDNNGLEDTVKALELIYTTIDWPLQVRSNKLLYN